MIEVSITPDELAKSVQPTYEYVKTRLAQAGIPVIIDHRQGLQFTAPGHIHIDFSHEAQVYQWVPAVDALQFDEVAA